MRRQGCDAGRQGPGEVAAAQAGSQYFGRLLWRQPLLPRRPEEASLVAELRPRCMAAASGAAGRQARAALHPTPPISEQQRPWPNGTLHALLQPRPHHQSAACPPARSCPTALLLQMRPAQQTTPSLHERERRMGGQGPPADVLMASVCCPLKCGQGCQHCTDLRGLARPAWRRLQLGSRMSRACFPHHTARWQPCGMPPRPSAACHVGCPAEAAGRGEGQDSSAQASSRGPGSDRERSLVQPQVAHAHARISSP